MLSQRPISESQLTQWLVDAQYLYSISHINLGLKGEMMSLSGETNVVCRKACWGGGVGGGSACLSCMGCKVSADLSNKDQELGKSFLPPLTPGTRPFLAVVPNKKIPWEGPKEAH